MNEPIICFGQQPSGFFPKRFLVAKIHTALKLKKEIGGKIVFFYHDSDADYRETITILRDIKTGDEVRLNFTQENKLQKKFSPLYLKRIPSGWKEETLKQLPRFISPSPNTSHQGRGSISVPPPLGGRQGGGLINIFKSVDEKFVADFCLEMYKKMGLLDGIDVVRSSDKNFREAAPEIREGFADIEFEGEIVRAKIETKPSTLYPSPYLSLHEGGGRYTNLPKSDKIEKYQISAGADERFFWMNSVIKCTHYIFGEGEKDYLKFHDFPEVKFIQRDKIENPDFAWMG